MGKSSFLINKNELNLEWDMCDLMISLWLNCYYTGGNCNTVLVANIYGEAAQIEETVRCVFFFF